MEEIFKTADLLIRNPLAWTTLAASAAAVAAGSVALFFLRCWRKEAADKSRIQGEWIAALREALIRRDAK